MAKQLPIDRAILEMALVGYQQQYDRVEESIRVIRFQLDGPEKSNNGSGRTRFSAAARKRMAAAQRKRRKSTKQQKVVAKRTPVTKRKAASRIGKKGIAAKKSSARGRNVVSNAKVAAAEKATANQ
jgi:hypothetical protein